MFCETNATSDPADINSAVPLKHKFDGSSYVLRLAPASLAFGLVNSIFRVREIGIGQGFAPRNCLEVQGLKRISSKLNECEQNVDFWPNLIGFHEIKL